MITGWALGLGLALLATQAGAECLTPKALLAYQLRDRQWSNVLFLGPDSTAQISIALKRNRPVRERERGQCAIVLAEGLSRFVTVLYFDHNGCLIDDYTMGRSTLRLTLEPDQELLVDQSDDGVLDARRATWQAKCKF